ncbi:MAG TPA: hypothetical protein VMU60_12865 [Syntrophobacteria bacterium]|nr:hypothetical protein [Syntrophobacteria bacterium]
MTIAHLHNAFMDLLLFTISCSLRTASSDCPTVDGSCTHLRQEQRMKGDCAYRVAPSGGGIGKVKGKRNGNVIFPFLILIRR